MLYKLNRYSLKQYALSVVAVLLIVFVALSRSSDTQNHLLNGIATDQQQSTQQDIGNGLTLPAPPKGQKWAEVFSDEFIGNTLDTKKWTTCYDWQDMAVPGCSNDGNEELQWYTRDSVSVADNAVTFIAKKTAVVGLRRGETHNFDYTSGMITTGRDNKDAKVRWTARYGYYQARIKMPKGRGLWPAFWLVPADQKWPPEIDVMEMLGDKPGDILMTYFWDNGKFPPPKDSTTFSGNDLSGDWHTFGIDWAEGKLDWYIDGLLRKSVRSENVPTKAMEIILNLAVGGKLPGSPDDQTPFPSTMAVDAVKVHQLVNL